LIKGFKFNEKLVKDLSSRYGQGFYRYKKSRKNKVLFKLRLYSIVIYYLFQSIKINGEVSLKICRDFEGRENDIKKNLKYFLGTLLGLNIKDNIYFIKLDTNSNADRYFFLMRHDNKNKMNTYIKIELDDFEKWLKK